MVAPIRQPRPVAREVLVNAFQPSAEITEPERFAGRRRQIAALTDGLYADGAVPVIYGDRGLGKSSLAQQMRLIALGGTELLHSLHLDRRVLPESRRLFVFYVRCTSKIKNTSDLLSELIVRAENAHREYEDSNIAGEGRLVDKTTKKRLKLKIVELESEKRYESVAQSVPSKTLSDEARLVTICEILSEVFGRPVLFIIDEIDRMQDTRGLAGFIKAHSVFWLRFILVGIAGNLSELIDDHESIQRQLLSVNVPPMDVAELTEVVTKAERYLGEHGSGIVFSRQARSRLAQIASGYPWFVHILGKDALLRAADFDESVIGESSIGRGVLRLAENEFAQQYADKYQSAVRDSWQRELTLRAFAQWTDVDIPTREVYETLKRLDVSNPSQLRKHLEEMGILYRPSFQRRGLIRFRNEIFKVYCRLRTSIYHGADGEVREAFGLPRDLDFT